MIFAQWKSNLETRSLSDLTGHGDRAAVERNEFFNEGQADACAFKRAARNPFYPVEALK